MERKKVVIRAPLLSLSGYGVHSRQVFRWVMSKDVDLYSMIVPWGVCTFLLDESEDNGTIGHVMRTSEIPQGIAFDVSYQVQLPDEWDPTLAKFNVGVTAGVETDICSREWVAACHKMDLVVVPSEFTKTTFVRSGVPKDKIVVIPEHHNFRQPTNRDLFIKENIEKFDTKFNFLIFGQITAQSAETDRKNTFYAIKWLAEVFKDNPDVGVVIKSGLGRCSTIDRKQSGRMLSKLIQEVRKGPGPKFFLAHGRLNHEEISGMYLAENIKALVAPTRGEGWGLTILDAAAAGLPVVATKYSGHMDFMSKVRFIGLEYKLKNIAQQKVDGRVFIEGSRWAEVSETDFKKKIKKLYRSYDVPKSWAEEGKEIIRESFSEKAIMSIYDEKLSKTLR